jgi:hypothetical protein
VTTPPTEPQEQHDRLRADGERELSVWRIAEDLMRQSPGSTFEFPDAPQGQHIALVRYVADRLAADATKQRDAELEQLRAENERLRVEVERLRAQLDWATPDKEPFDASKNAFFSMRSDLRLDGCSTLSLHRVGVDVHLRVQHHGVDHYAVAVLQPGDVRSLAQALAPRPSLPAEATPDGHALALAREVVDETPDERLQGLYDDDRCVEVEQCVNGELAIRVGNQLPVFVFAEQFRDLVLHQAAMSLSALPAWGVPTPTPEWRPCKACGLYPDGDRAPTPEPQPGDTVRVTYEAEYEEDWNDGHNVVSAGWDVQAPPGSTVEVISRKEQQ